MSVPHGVNGALVRWPRVEGAHAQDWVDGEDVVVATDLDVRARPARAGSSSASAAGVSTSRTTAARSSWPVVRTAWLAVAERVVDEHAVNVNRSGVVFVQSNEERLEPLIARVADCSVALYQELLERELGSP